ncbi:MAG: hemerythrin domain-containing protein [Vicinamibacteria bacterium]
MIYEKLMKDHQEALALFDQIAETGDDEVRKRDRLFQKLTADLTRHARAEERVFYPALRDHEDTRPLVEESLEEHKEVESILDQLQRMERDNAEWLETVLELRESVQHHIDEEESTLFQKARHLLSEEEADELALRFDKEKSKAA